MTNGPLWTVPDSSSSVRTVGPVANTCHEGAWQSRGLGSESCHPDHGKPGDRQGYRRSQDQRLVVVPERATRSDSGAASRWTDAGQRRPGDVACRHPEPEPRTEVCLRCCRPQGSGGSWSMVICARPLAPASYSSTRRMRIGRTARRQASSASVKRLSVRPTLRPCSGSEREDSSPSLFRTLFAM